MVDMRFLLPFFYSAVTFLGSTYEKIDKNMVYPIISDTVKLEESVEYKTSSFANILTGIYTSAYDVDSNNSFDMTDVSRIALHRRNQLEAEEKLAREAEEARLREEEKRLEVERIERERLEAQQPAVTEEQPEIEPQPVVTTAPVQETPQANVSFEKISNGIDVSRWQGKIDWQKIKESGVEFAIIKAGEGLEVAPRFYENITNAKAAGINCGVYWFSQARSTDDARAEALACLDIISGYALEYPVVYDCEYRSLNNNPLADNKTLLTDTVLTFLETIQNNGYYSMLYTNTDFSERYLEFDRIKGVYDIWFAGYKVKEPAMECGMWQYSEHGTMDGLDIENLNGGTTYVDLDISYKNYPEIMKYFHINGY
ncbi:MAG: hypothetical protein E7505_02500 [Ruminococcus sp.]|nr:hypothetical protein [Ruminococcus sp.]